MLREVYKQYIRVSRGISERSVSHYITAVNSINSILIKNDFPIRDVFSVRSIGELESIKEFLFSNAEFLLKDSIGHNMYSVAFRHFYRFACEDERFFSESIRQMDIPVKETNPIQPIQVESQTWKRNQIIKEQAIQAANYLCENDHRHLTFIAKATGKPFMEGHHLIPIQHQRDFCTSLDVYANIVCLCPTCHRLLHFGTSSEKMYVVEKMYDIRSERLINSGIDLSRQDFLKIVI